MSENVVWPAKYIFLTAAGLITMIALGGWLGFAAFSQDFLDNLDTYEKYEMGRDSDVKYITLPGGEQVMYVNLAIDGKIQINSTHGIVYWFQKIQLKPGATILDAVHNLTNAEYVELREYELGNPSNWVSIVDTNASNYKFNITVGDVSGIEYIQAINGIEEHPGYGTFWQTYGWKESTGTFEYIYSSASKYQVSHGDNFIMLFDELNALPTDCCSGGGFQYEGYEGPN